MERKTMRGLSALSLISQIGVIMVTSVALGVYFGRFLDVYFGTQFLFTLVLLILGAGGGFLGVYRLIEGIDKRN